MGKHAGAKFCLDAAEVVGCEQRTTAGAGHAYLSELRVTGRLRFGGSHGLVVECDRLVNERTEGTDGNGLELYPGRLVNRYVPALATGVVAGGTDAAEALCVQGADHAILGQPALPAAVSVPQLQARFRRAQDGAHGVPV